MEKAADTTDGTMHAVELFCGAGGMSLGFMRAGIKVVRAYDNSPEAILVYRRNLGDHAELLDLNALNTYGPAIAVLAPDLVFGGPPCQDFSPAGARVEGANADLTKVFAMVVSVARPDWFVMENVAHAGRSVAFHAARDILAKAGYGLTQVVLDAAFYRTPQHRRRLFLIGRLEEEDGFLEAALLGAAASSPMTLRDEFGDDIAPFLYFHPRYRDRRGIRSADEPAATIRNAMRPMPEAYVPHPADAHPAAHQPGTTACSGRPMPSLTRDQVARVQGFPADWDWDPAGSLALRDKLVSNAVPSRLAEAVARQVLLRQAGVTVRDIPVAYRRWLRHNYPRQVAANYATRLTRAWKLLRGRVFADVAVALSRLERAESFTALGIRTRSELRSALRLYAQWRERYAETRAA